MAVNRFSRGFRPQPYNSTYVDEFIPLPLNAIGRSGELLQQREDRAIEQLDAVEATMAETGRNIADVDRPQFNRIGEQYRERINALPEDGVYFNKMRQIKGMAREFADIASPFLENRTAIKAATDAILENETLSSTDKQRRLQALTGDYTGLALDDSGRIDRSTMFRGRTFANRVDIASIADKAVSGIKAFKGEGITVDPEGRLITTSGETVSRDRVQSIAASAIYNSPEAMNFIQDEVELALRENPDANPEEIRNQLVNTAISQAVNKYAYNNTGISVQRDPALIGKDGETSESGFAMTRAGKSMDTSIASASDYDRRISKAREEGNEELAQNLETDRRFAKQEFMDSPQFGSIAASMFGAENASNLTDEQKREAFDKWEKFKEFRESAREKVDQEGVSGTYAPTRAQMRSRPQDQEGRKRRTVQKQLQEEFGEEEYKKLVNLDTQFNNFLGKGRATTDFTITPATAKAINDMQSIFSDVARPSEFEVVGSGEDAEELKGNLGKYFSKMDVVSVSIGDALRPENYVDVKYQDEAGVTREARLRYTADPREGDLVDVALRQVGSEDAEALRRERNTFGRSLLTDEYKPIARGSDISLALTPSRGVKAKVGSRELTSKAMWDRSKDRASEQQIVDFAQDLANSAHRHNIQLTTTEIEKGLKGESLVGDKRKAFEELMDKPILFDRRYDAFEAAAFFKREQ